MAALHFLNFAGADKEGDHVGNLTRSFDARAFM
jgi:hypothetical protein